MPTCRSKSQNHTSQTCLDEMTRDDVMIWTHVPTKWWRLCYRFRTDAKPPCIIMFYLRSWVHLQLTWSLVCNNRFPSSRYCWHRRCDYISYLNTWFSLKRSIKKPIMCNMFPKFKAEQNNKFLSRNFRSIVSVQLHIWIGFHSLSCDPKHGPRFLPIRQLPSYSDKILSTTDGP
jgi:hypothetical protein